MLQAALRMPCWRCNEGACHTSEPSRLCLEQGYQTKASWNKYNK